MPLLSRNDWMTLLSPDSTPEAVQAVHAKVHATQPAKAADQAEKAQAQSEKAQAQAAKAQAQAAKAQAQAAKAAAQAARAAEVQAANAQSERVSRVHADRVKAENLYFDLYEPMKNLKVGDAVTIEFDRPYADSVTVKGVVITSSDGFKRIIGSRGGETLFRSVSPLIVYDPANKGKRWWYVEKNGKRIGDHVIALSVVPS